MSDSNERHGERDGAESVEDYQQGRERVGHLGRKHEDPFPLQTHESRLVPARKERELCQELERYHLVHPHRCPILLPNFRYRQSLL